MTEKKPKEKSKWFFLADHPISKKTDCNDIQGDSPRQWYLRRFASMYLALLKIRYLGRFALKKKTEAIRLSEDEITKAIRRS